MRTGKKLILFFIIVSFTITTLYIIKKRASIYPYDVSKDYQYNFQKSDANITNLNLKNGKFFLPKTDNNQTAFLKLKLNTTLIGKYLQPSIKVTDGNLSRTHYFEHAAEGARYINISSFISSGNELEITLKGNHFLIKNQIIQLILFNNKKIKHSKILVLSPHPDDAEIAAYGLYSNNNNQTYIVTVTAGEAGENKYDEVYTNPNNQYLKKGKLRTWDSITIPLLGGIPLEHTVNLGFFDSTLNVMYQNKSKIVKGIYTDTSDINTFRQYNISNISTGLSGQSNWTSLVENFKYLLKEIKPDIIVMPYPSLDRHLDHKFSSIAMIEALKKSNIKNGKLYLYTNHLTMNELYPYGEMDGIISIPPNLEQEIYFKSIYSHTLSADDQKDKILVLESMHDLRLDTEWRFFEGALKVVISNIRREITGRNYSYYRRAARYNELFFIVDIEDIYNEKKLSMITGEL